MSMQANPRLSRGALVALVVGSMVGAGIFTLPAAFARGTGALGALVAWAIASASLMLWAVHALVSRGVRQAAALNTIATVAKTVPIGIFIFVVVLAFDAEVFALNLWGGTEPGLAGVAAQVRATMLVTVFVFVGIEGASVYSRYARDRNDVGLATVLGFLGVLCLLMLVTVLSYGILPRADLAALPNPSMAGVMEAVVGPWGRVFVSVGLIVSVLGNYLSWTLLAAEVPVGAALRAGHVAVCDGAARAGPNPVRPARALAVRHAVRRGIGRAGCAARWQAHHLIPWRTPT